MIVGRWIERRTRPADTAGIASMVVIAAVGGAVVGLVAGTFRWILEHLEDGRASLLDHSRELPGPGWMLAIVAVAACAALARLVVRIVPPSAGSGIQDVEAVWRGEAEPPSLLVLPAKFGGGLLAIGSGLSLGREGPTVHMGATVGAVSGRLVRLTDADIRVLQAALGGAGLAVAFNAPLGGALFVFEEVARTFRTRVVLATLVACATAISISRTVLADAPEFDVIPIATPSGLHLVVYGTFGIMIGLLGVGYGGAVMGGLRLADRIGRVTPELRAAVIGAALGALLVADPFLAGDGLSLVQRLFNGEMAMATAAGYLIVRFAVGPVSYAAGTPGGLFAPLLAVGAVAGMVFHQAVSGLLGFDDPASAFVVVGMAAFFAAVIRAPFTGIVLVLEMTANTTLLAPLFAACFAAVLTTTLLGSAPIYDRLWERVVREPGEIRSGPEPG